MRLANSGKWEAYFVNENSSRRELEQKLKGDFISYFLGFHEFQSKLIVNFRPYKIAAGINVDIVFKLLNQIETRDKISLSKNFMLEICILDFLQPKPHFATDRAISQIISLTRAFISSALCIYVCMLQCRQSLVEDKVTTNNSLLINSDGIVDIWH